SNASNGSDNRHGIVEYLNDTIVAGVLRPLLA
ncbi:endopeptidase, partial [Pseudomonas frederiksbergensis]|nr:endopeptidase [Pseudomonas frederiksbergensis]